MALALAVIAVFFIFPGLSPFHTKGAAHTAAPSATEPATATTTAPSPSASANGLEATDEVVGTGALAQAGDTVTVNYVGILTDGTVFDASARHGTSGFTFVLGAGQVIKGWDEGIVGMREGGTRKLVIPSALAYGDQAVGGVIPANATLVFEIELVKVQK